MSILDNDNNGDDDAANTAPRQEPRQEAEILTGGPAQVILDIRRDIRKFQAGGARKEMVEALKDQFIATRHQAATKAEAVRMLALDILRARIHEIKTVPELMRVISALSKMSENDLAAVYGVVPGAINIQQSIGPEGVTGVMRVTQPPNSRVLESFELLNKAIKEKVSKEKLG
jgi:hypothetical protein